MAYLPACEMGGLEQLFRFSRAADVRAGFCTKGPHREYFDIVIDGKHRAASPSMLLSAPNVWAAGWLLTGFCVIGRTALA